MVELTESRIRAQQFKNLVQQKIKDLLQEFVSGQISREQFHLIYERYHSQLEIANRVLLGAPEEVLESLHTGRTTLTIREVTRGRALGAAVYHHRSGTMIETLGSFDVPPAHIVRTMNRVISQPDRAPVRTEKIDPTLWLLYVHGRHTTVILLFRNEPAPQQIRQAEQIHRDFEEANAGRLPGTAAIKADELAYPVLAMIGKTLKNSADMD